MTSIQNSHPTRWHTWFGLSCLYLSLLGWYGLTTHMLTVCVAGLLFGMVLTAFCQGDLLLKWLLKDQPQFDNMPFRLASGMLLGVACFYLSALLLPFGLLLDGVVVLGMTLLAWLLARRDDHVRSFQRDSTSEVIFIVLVLIAVSLWCRDLLRPIDSTQAVAVIRVWGDVYYHLSQIGAFAHSKGASTIFDVQMAGAVAHPYHFASYVFPALLVNAAGMSAWTAYASFLVPVGVLLTALAAYAIAASVFGKWPAAAAGLALLLLPDASQQGFRNPFMGYHWLQQVGPAGSYGVASAAMAFLFMIEACRARRISLILVSYIFMLVTLVFKAQIFVAIAFVLLVFPAVFFRDLAASHRVMAVLVLTAVFAAVVTWSQSLPSVPVMRLDGSSLSSYSKLILDMQRHGPIKVIFSGAFELAGEHGFFRGLVFGLMLLLVTFGVFPVLYAMQVKRLRQQFEPVIWLFPMLVVAVYLCMAIGLAMDDRHIGMPEELLHRPFVWAYFVLVVWLVAAAYRGRFGDAWPTMSAARNWVAVAAVLMVVVPGRLGHGIQTMQSWGRGYQEVPSCLVKTAGFIRSNSQAGELVQDASNDPEFILSALSERPPYAIDSGGVRVPLGMPARLQTLAALREVPTSVQATTLMRQLGIRWYVVGPSAKVAWAQGSTRGAAFTCGDYKVWRSF